MNKHKATHREAPKNREAMVEDPREEERAMKWHEVVSCQKGVNLCHDYFIMSTLKKTDLEGLIWCRSRGYGNQLTRNCQK